MKPFTRLLLSLALACLTALSIHGCDSTSTSVHYSVGYGGYYGGAGWYDPYYRYPPVYGRPVGPPPPRPPGGYPPRQASIKWKQTGADAFGSTSGAT